MLEGSSPNPVHRSAIAWIRWNSTFSDGYRALGNVTKWIDRTPDHWPAFGESLPIVSASPSPLSNSRLVSFDAAWPRGSVRTAGLLLAELSSMGLIVDHIELQEGGEE